MSPRGRGAELRAFVDENAEGALVADGFDECVVGVLERCGQPNIVVYDTQAVIDKLVAQGMDQEEATEYFDFNIAGAWLGETTPGFIVWAPGCGGGQAKKARRPCRSRLGSGERRKDLL